MIRIDLTWVENMLPFASKGGFFPGCKSQYAFVRETIASELACDADDVTVDDDDFACVNGVRVAKVETHYVPLPGRPAPREAQI